MKEHLKITVSIIMMSIILISASVQVFANTTGTMTVNLQDITDMALKNSSSLQLLDDKIKLAAERYNTALTQVDTHRNDSPIPKDKIIEKDKILNLYPLQKENDLNELKWEKQDKIDTLKIDITNLYYELIMKQQEIKLQQSAAARSQDEYNTKKQQVQVGTAVANDLDPLEEAVESAGIKLETLQRDYEKLLMDLNNKAGLDLNQQLNLKDQTLPDFSVYKVNDIDKLVTDLVPAIHSVMKLEKDKELAQKERDIVYSDSFYKPDNLDTMDDNILNLQYDIRDEKVNVEYKIRSDYNNLLNLEDDITLKKLEYDKDVKLADIAKTRYNLGLINYLSYSKAQGDTDDAWFAYQQAQLDYYTAMLNFKNYIEQE